MHNGKVHLTFGLTKKVYDIWRVQMQDKLTDTQKLDKLLVLIDLLNMEIKGIRKLIIDTHKESKK
jgi:hypothetical protein